MGYPLCAIVYIIGNAQSLSIQNAAQNDVGIVDFKVMPLPMLVAAIKSIAK